MAKAISNTSPLLYLHRIESMAWLPQLFEEIWIAPAVAAELQKGQGAGLWVSDDLRRRILALAGEDAP